MAHKLRWGLHPTIAVLLLSGASGALFVPLIGASSGLEASLRFVGVLIIAAVLLLLLLHALRRRAGPEPYTLANVLTLSRLVTGCVLAAFVFSGARDRTQTAAVVIWALVVYSATFSDWLDGPLARREGATRFGAVLDIESDSWLTLWCSVAAITLGGISWICLLAPVVRYVLPLFDIYAGNLPVGGGPWWSRVTGVVQMAVLIAGFAPIVGTFRDAILGVIVWPVSLAQLATMLALLALRRR